MIEYGIVESWNVRFAEMEGRTIIKERVTQWLWPEKLGLSALTPVRMN